MPPKLAKNFLERFYFQPGKVRPILFGPLRGSKFRVSPITGMSPWYSGTERQHQQVFARRTKPGDVVLDVGANWGLHTLYLSRCVGAAGKVIALEPYPPAYAELVWHLQANGCSNVIALNLALSDEDAQVQFETGENASEGKLVDGSGGAEVKRPTLSVQARRLDALWKELKLPPPALAKIDVEGAEGRVLHGSEAVTAAHHPKFIIDLHNPEQDVEVAGWLVKRGYQLQRLSGEPILKTELGWPEPEGVWGSLLATRQGNV